ncbi:hypothetical protein IGI04_020042, partial [Brassica rapa subsp. trilocularis]
MSKKGYRTRELEAANFTHRGMSCIRYGEGGKGMADGGCSVSSIEGVKSSDQVADTENHSDPNQEEDPSLDNSSQMLVLQTPPKPFNMHTREVDDSDDFVGQVPQCVLSRPTHDTSDGEDEDDDFVEPVPICVS